MHVVFSYCYLLFVVVFSVLQREAVMLAQLGAMPPGYHTQQSQAHHFYLACTMLPKDVSAL